MTNDLCHLIKFLYWQKDMIFTKPTYNMFGQLFTDSAIRYLFTNHRMYHNLILFPRETILKYWNKIILWINSRWRSLILFYFVIYDVCSNCFVIPQQRKHFRLGRVNRFTCARAHASTLLNPGVSRISKRRLVQATRGPRSLFVQSKKTRAAAISGKQIWISRRVDNTQPAIFLIVMNTYLHTSMVYNAREGLAGFVLNVYPLE